MSKKKKFLKVDSVKDPIDKTKSDSDNIYHSDNGGILKRFLASKLDSKKMLWNKKQSEFLKKNKGKVVLVKMELVTGQFREFLVLDELGSFVYRANRYVFDYSLKYYIIERDIWAYDFHEFLSIPLRKQFSLSDKMIKLISPAIDKTMKNPKKPHIDIDEVKALVESSEIIDVEASLNPATLKRFTDSEVIKQVLQGTMIGRIFKVMFVLIIILVVLTLLQVIITLWQSGVIDQVIGSIRK